MSFSLASKSSTAPAPAVKRSVLSKSKSEREKEDRKKVRSLYENFEFRLDGKVSNVPQLIVTTD